MGISTKKFNVLCVTKRYKDDKDLRPTPPIFWHVPITGEAELITESEEKFGVNIAKSEVRFNGMKCKLLHVRSGLSGTALTLGIEVLDLPFAFNVWELYTDSPADEIFTSAEIRSIAQHCIEMGRPKRLDLLRDML